MEPQATQSSEPSFLWILVKIAVVILIVFLGVKFFSEKRQSDEEKSFVERKKTKPKSRKKKKND
jgi:uncharacterized membrane protein SirB2